MKEIFWSKFLFFIQILRLLGLLTFLGCEVLGYEVLRLCGFESVIQASVLLVCCWTNRQIYTKFSGCNR